MTLRIIDTFAGIGGFSLAAHWLGGFQTVQFVEWEPYCQQILRQNFPDVPIHGDITTFHPAAGSADVVCGGFPCQDISLAGKQAGIKEGTRSGLFYELMRVIRLVRPQFVILENVAAIRNNGLDVVLGQMAEAGYDCEWACIRASDVGACHRRDRWWLVAYPSCQQRNDGEFAHTTEPSRTAAQLGNSNRADAADSDHPRSQGLWPQRQLREGGSEVATPWSNGPRLSADWRSYLSEPVLCRGDDGLSHRVDRLKALGNAVVPQVAMIPLLRVLDLHHGKC